MNSSSGQLQIISLSPLLSPGCLALAVGLEKKKLLTRLESAVVVGLFQGRIERQLCFNDT